MHEHASEGNQTQWTRYMTKYPNVNQSTIHASLTPDTMPLEETRRSKPTQNGTWTNRPENTVSRCQPEHDTCLVNKGLNASREIQTQSTDTERRMNKSPRKQGARVSTKTKDSMPLGLEDRVYQVATTRVTKDSMPLRPEDRVSECQPRLTKDSMPLGKSRHG